MDDFDWERPALWRRLAAFGNAALRAATIAAGVSGVALAASGLARQARAEGFDLVLRDAEALPDLPRPCPDCPDEPEPRDPWRCMTDYDIAALAHEVNRAYCRAIGDDSQPAWEDAPDWQQESAAAGVRLHLERDATPEESHAAWMAHKAADGWTYGPIKDADAKTHPCMVPYADLPVAQRAKDYLFAAVVRYFR